MPASPGSRARKTAPAPPRTREKFARRDFSYGLIRLPLTARSLVAGVLCTRSISLRRPCPNPGTPGNRKARPGAVPLALSAAPIFGPGFHRQKPFYPAGMELNLQFLPRTRKDVSDAAHRLDVFIAVGVAQLLANLADVHVNAAVEGREFTAEHRVHQPFPRNHSPRLAQQHFEQIEFHRSQVHRLPIQPDRPR